METQATTTAAPAAYAPVNVAHAVMDMIYDIGSVADTETAEIRLKRNGQPLPIFVLMAGPEHPKRKKYALDKQRRMRKQLQATGQMVLGDPLEDQLEEDELLASCTLGWRMEGKRGKEMVSVPYIVFNGDQVECTVQNIAKIFADPERQWFRRSLKEAFDNGEAFIKVSASD